MKLSYYPGCTVKNHAANFESSMLSSMKRLGVQIEELDRWNCCGTVYSLASDDLMKQMAPIRNLVRAKEQNSSQFMTSCAMCYNTIKRANETFKSDEDAKKRLNDFMYLEDTKYEGDVEVVHLLEFLRDKIGFDKLSENVKRPLEGLKVANYYGCLLVRPEEVAFDDAENPTVMDDLTTALGGEPVEFSHKTECCGAFQTVDKPEIIADRTNLILEDAQNEGADIVSVSCPLCAFNLDHRQKETARKYSGFKHTPVVYFTQMMAVALNCKEKSLQLDLHYIDPKPVLKDKGLL